MDSASPPPAATRRNICIGLVMIGALLSVFAFQDARQRERERAETEFVHRVSIRHALTREVLGRYEDALFGLAGLFMLDDKISRAEFAQVAHRLEEHDLGVQAFEWVPSVAHARRAEVETTLQRDWKGYSFEFTDLAADGGRVRASDRAAYYPIAYIQPMAGNERALGYDLMNGPNRVALAQARATRRAVLTGQFRLVQEKATQLGVILILPVYRPPGSTTPPASDEFVGFVQGVFRVHDLLELTCRRHPDESLDMLFVDGSERDPAKRLLYYRPAAGSVDRSAAPDEENFSHGLALEQSLPIGGRNWRLLYRPRAGWIEEQYSKLPWVRVSGVLTLTGLLVGLILALGRRTDHIRQQVHERTAELNESRRQLHSMLHALPGMAYRATYDDAFDIIFISDGAETLTGYPREEFLSRRLHFRDLIHPDDLARVRAVTFAGFETAREIEVECRMRTREGREKWVLSRGRGVFATGQPPMFEGLSIDITAQKEAETARLGLERKLLEGQKLESLGLLAGGIAHDFNNLLTGILGNASLARLVLPAGSAVDPQLQGIETASLRAAELCRQMLAYAGKGNFLVEPTDLSSLAEGLVPLLEISLARRATLRLDLDRRLPAVMADPTQLRQIAMNLVLNAADATSEKGGEIELTTGRIHASEAMLNAAAAGAGLPAGDYVFLAVRDHGCGMTPEVIAKIFDPFFTTKFAGRGLGLAATLGIVRSHRGALMVESQPGRGSTFRLLLPPTATPAATASAERTSAGQWRCAANVLVIDDDEAVRDVTASFLRSFGLTVRTAVGGHAGLALLRENPAGCDLVVLDLLMPGLSGEQTLEALRVIRSDLRVLLISGYHEGETLSRFGDGPGPLAFLHKPYTREALEEKLRELLA